MMMRRLPLLLLALLLVAPAAAQPNEPFHQPPGSRLRTAEEARLYHTGIEELQPEVLRPANFPRMSEADARAELREILAGQPDRSLESLREGHENYRSVRERLRRLAELHPDAIRVQTIGKPSGLKVDAVELFGGPPTDGKPKTRVLILGGVHAGTEVTGMESAVRFIESAVKDPALRSKYQFTFVPLVNPAALVLGTRRNVAGIDINRTFMEGKWTPESRVTADFVRTKTFDVALDLHTAGDRGRDGFFLIRGAADRGMGQRIVSAMPPASLMDVAPGEKAVGPYKLYSLGASEIGSTQGTSKGLLVELGTPYVYTFEAPTRANPEWQVRGMLRMVNSALENTRKHGVLIEEARAARRGEKPDRLAAFRNSDGTLSWKKLRGRAALESAGLANFGLALFLKELAVVAKTGDRARIEEFFEGLMTTDFYKEYGLFVLGARAGEVAYVRYLERFVKPRFVSGILRTNLILAAGLALPRIADGTFSGKAFVISLASLGISSAAVSTGMSSIRWVTNLKTARSTGALSRLGLGASRFAKLGGWFYKAAELAVVLYFAEDIENAINAHLDLKAARGAFADAGVAFAGAVANPAATPESVRAATERFHEAAADYRNFLYRPLYQDEAIFAARMEKVARKAKLAADQRRNMVERVARYPALKDDIERRFGSIEAYADALAEESEREVAEDVATYADSYGKARDEHLREVYEENQRGTRLLDGVDTEFVFGGADPHGDRTDAYANHGRRRARAALRDALEDVSENRLEAYQDEVYFLTAAARALEARGADASAVRETITSTLKAYRMDHRLVHDADGVYLSTHDAEGAAAAVEAAAR